MRAVAAEWVGVFLAVQQSGSGRAISEALPIGPEKKKKRNICLLYDGANEGGWAGGWAGVASRGYMSNRYGRLGGWR